MGKQEMYKDVICDNDGIKQGRDWDIWSKILYNIETDWWIKLSIRREIGRMAIPHKK